MKIFPASHEAPFDRVNLIPALAFSRRTHSFRGRMRAMFPGEGCSLRVHPRLTSVRRRSVPRRRRARPGRGARNKTPCRRGEESRRKLSPLSPQHLRRCRRRRITEVADSIHDGRAGRGAFSIPLLRSGFRLEVFSLRFDKWPWGKFTSFTSSASLANAAPPATYTNGERLTGPRLSPRRRPR